MRKVGMVVAVEGDALLQKYGEGYDLGDGRGTMLYQTQKTQIYAIQCGAGEIFAASATQYLIDRYEVCMVLNFGIVGACDSLLEVGDTCVVDRVVHYQYDLSDVDGVPAGRYLEYDRRRIPTSKDLADKAVSIVPALHRVTCASGNKFMGDPEEKEMLHDEFKAHICDMESAAILLTCDLNKVPCLMIKTVSDGVRGGADEYWRTKAESSRLCLDIVDKIVDEL